MRHRAGLLLVGIFWLGCQRQAPADRPTHLEDPYIFVEDGQNFGGGPTPAVSDPVFCIRIPTEAFTNPAPAPHQRCPAR